MTFEPYESEYEGYMGNWGNTLDRWYHRAALVIWPREQAFANRAEPSPPWALDELAAMASPGDLAGARRAAATLASFWEAAARGATYGKAGAAPGLFGSALRAGDAIADAETAALLLRPFRIEDLTEGHVSSFGKVADGYGQQWTAELLRAWFGGNQPDWAYVGARERPEWVACQLPGLCAGLHTTGRAGTVAAQRLLDLAWEWISKEIRNGLALSPPSQRDKELGDLGRPLAALLMAAAAIGAASTRGHCFRKYRAAGRPCHRARNVRTACSGGRGMGRRWLRCPGRRLRGTAPRPAHPPAAHPAIGRLNCPRAAHASSAARFVPSWHTPIGKPSAGRSPRTAGSTSTPGST